MRWVRRVVCWVVNHRLERKFVLRRTVTLAGVEWYYGNIYVCTRCGLELTR